MEMAHFFFIDKILSALGWGDFAHHNSHLTHTWFVMAILIVCGVIFARNVKMVPKKGQNILELIIEKLEDFMVGITGPEGRFFFPYIATVFLFIFVSNLIGLIPGFFSPTADINTTVGLAICTFVLTHVIGVKFHGVKYLKHFLGPVWWLAPLMIVLELIGHFARIMSLSIRLFGNIFGKEMVLSFLFMLAGFYLAPLPILVLGLLVSFLQALVFTLLSIVYFSGAMEEAH